MKNYINITRNEKSVDNITCNLCGKSIEKNQWGYFDPYLSINQTWGFGSEYDGETHHIDICSSCYNKLLKTMAIKPNEPTE